ncbi:MAG: hypothetical protein ACC645_00050 [Pirellulales bacterium]
MEVLRELGTGIISGIKESGEQFTRGWERGGGWLSPHSAIGGASLDVLVNQVIVAPLVGAYSGLDRLQDALISLVVPKDYTPLTAALDVLNAGMSAADYLDRAKNLLDDLIPILAARTASEIAARNSRIRQAQSGRDREWIYDDDDYPQNNIDWYDWGQHVGEGIGSAWGGGGVF